MYERDCLIGVHMEAQAAWMRSLLVILSGSVPVGDFFRRHYTDRSADFTCVTL
jgi:hypothetical protein